jgi:hypothetical protein
VNGCTRENDGAACCGHRADDGILDGVVVLELLSKPVDDEQRVVDRQTQADELDEVGDVGSHHGGVRDGVDEPEGRRDRRACEQERERDDRGWSKHEEEDDERRGNRDCELTVAEVAAEDRSRSC